MKTLQISLNSIDKVKSFVNDITRFENDFDLVSGRYVIDAKSIMGIFSLDLSKPIDLNIHAEENIDAILDILHNYIRTYTIDKNKAAAVIDSSLFCLFTHRNEQLMFLLFQWLFPLIHQSHLLNFLRDV